MRIFTDCRLTLALGAVFSFLALSACSPSSRAEAQTQGARQEALPVEYLKVQGLRRAVRNFRDSILISGGRG